MSSGFNADQLITPNLQLDNAAAVANVCVVTDDELRQYSRIAMLNSAGGAVGCGFVIDERHAFTCTHVIPACLGMDEEAALPLILSDLTIKVNVRFATPDKQVYREMCALPGHRHSWKDPDDPLRDICVLEIERKIPDGVNPVDGLKPFSGMHFSGVGLNLDYREGYPIEGRLLELNAMRHFACSTIDDADLQIYAGCSGAGAFRRDGASGRTHNQIIGMIDSYLGERSGTIIPANRLHEAWPQWKMTKVPNNPDNVTGYSAIAPKPQIAGIKIPNLEQALVSCDRAAQLDSFDTKRFALAGDGVQALMCTILGSDDDLPKLCELRLRNSVTQSYFAERAAEMPKVVESHTIHLDRFSGEDLRPQVRRMLASKLNARSSEPQALIAQIKVSRQPLIVKIPVSADQIAALKPTLIRDWNAVIEELVEYQLDVPVLVFILVTHPKKEQLDEVHADLAELEEQLNRFVNLSPLGLVKIDRDIASWADDEFDNTVGLGQKVRIYVQQKALDHGVTEFSLGQLYGWLAGAREGEGTTP